MQKLVLVSVVLLTALVLPAAGQAVTTEAFTTSQSTFDPGVRNQGWWSGTRINEDSNANYIVGQPDDGGGNRFRNFFTFDLSAACAASSVTLHLTRFEQSGPLTYSLFDVSTPAATLNDNVGPSQAIFDDLGSGISFGSFPVSTGATADVLSFRLNAAGVAAFNAARGGLFSIGGMTPAEATFGSHLFGFSVGSGTQQLVVTCLPTSKDECKHGEWRDFGVFKNQGDCVSFVATKGRNPPANSP